MFEIKFPTSIVKFAVALSLFDVDELFILVPS